MYSDYLYSRGRRDFRNKKNKKRQNSDEYINRICKKASLETSQFRGRPSTIEYGRM